MPRKPKYKPPTKIDLTNYTGNKRLFLLGTGIQIYKHYGWEHDILRWKLTRGTSQDGIQAFKEFFPDIKVITEKPKRKTRKK